MQINQFHSGTTVGDAVTNQMLLIRDLLRKNGYESEIYAEYVDEELKHIIKPIGSYKGNKDAILLVHHSMGMNQFEKIVGLPDTKALIYHNITPERFFDDEGTIKYIRIGLQQVKDYKKYMDYSIADSNYNRQELIKMGYDNNIDVMPVQVSVDRFNTVKENEEIVRENQDTKNILFVGRVVWNKRQDDVIKSFAVYNKYYNSQSKLFLVGDDGMQGYVEELRSLARYYGIENKVVITGKVPEEDLKAYYKCADLFLCMSEHEGFGVPLLEAMQMEIPVLAYRSSAIPETMDGAGIVVQEKNYAYIGALIHEIMSDKELYQKVVEKQRERIKRLEHTDTEKILLNIIEKIRNKNRKRTIQLQGPFESSYSLAIVNRKLMEAMDDLDVDDVSIYCTEGPGDYEPDSKYLQSIPHAKKLWEKSKQVSYPDVTIRNMYPPRVHDVNGGLNFFAFGWEESIIPQSYIENFNKHLTGIGTMSNYVTEKLIECGISIPVKTMGIGVELVENFEELIPFALKTERKIKFLHISSAFPRKGVDVLLKGFYETFNGNDDVCLVLKTFPNPHNNVEQLLSELKKQYSNPPEVEWINCDLSTEDINRLYKAADCYVQVARGEGFGLPVAEAMLAKVPVIVCPNSGMADFSNEDTALLVDYSLEPARTHVTTASAERVSMWAEPSVESLSRQLRYFVEHQGNQEIQQRIEQAYHLISTEYTWKKVAERWLAFVNETEKKQYKPKVAMVTTWNSKCGIAEYTRMETDATGPRVEYEFYPNYGVELLKKDGDNVHKRTWHSAFQGNMDELVDELIQSNSDIVHFQFNFGFFNVGQFGNAVERLSHEKKVVVTFHKTDDSDVAGKVVSLKSIAKQLNKCAAIVVHQIKDINTLVEFGVEREKIHLIVHGQVQYPKICSEFAKKKCDIKSSLVLGSYGFLLPHKGIKETIYAVAQLKEKHKDILYIPVCALHESQVSQEYLKECVDTVKRLGLEKNVRFVTDFLPNDESMKYLQACDMLVMPYQPSQESASGAIRFCIAAQRPIITTKQPIFEEFVSCTYQVSTCNPTEIAEGVENLWNSEKKSEYLLQLEKYVQETCWYNTARKFCELYDKLLNRGE